MFVPHISAKQKKLTQTIPENLAYIIWGGVSHDRGVIGLNNRSTYCIIVLILDVNLSNKLIKTPSINNEYCVLVLIFQECLSQLNH